MRLFLSIILFLMVFSTQSQILTGSITNEQHEPMAYATIYIEELQTGTCANQDGNYILHLKPGHYSITFRLLGYAPQVKNVVITLAETRLDIVLQIQSYILEGVTVRADAEDPAYSIMRKAIARAPQFANQALSYSSEVYIKGMLKIEKLPKILSKHMEFNGHHPSAGEIYVNESLNRIRYKAPDSYEQEVISVNNSFPVSESDVPVIGLMSGSIYETQEDFYISPFASNAFSHYNYKYEGLLQDGDHFINRIRVIPKRKSKLLVDGYLYIIDDLWCLYSYDITINPMYTKLHIKQHFAPVKGDNYFPVNMFLEADIKAMGAIAHGTYTTTIRYNSLVMNPLFAVKKTSSLTYQPDTATNTKLSPKAKAKSEQIDKKIEKLMESPEPTTREMIEMQKLFAQKVELQNQIGDNPLEIKSNYNVIIKDKSLIRDSVYWDSIRPVPASPDEKISYQKADELQKKNDSMPVWRKALNTFLTGNYEWERSKKFYVFYPGIINKDNIGFNPVDGWQLIQRTKIRWQIDSIHVIETKLMAGYAFSREDFFGKGQINFTYSPMNRGEFNIFGGYSANDFNSKGSPALLNGVYNLLLKDNYKKFYNDTYLELNNRIELVHGLECWQGFKWQQTSELKNSTNYSFLYQSKDYDDNIPVNDEIDSLALGPTKLAKASMELVYHFKQFYIVNKNRKRYQHTDYPWISLQYQVGLGFNQSYSTFHQIEAGIGQQIDLYKIAELKYQLKAGLFIDANNLHFSSYRHFRTIEEPFTNATFNDGYFLLNNYEYSTSLSYIEGHLKYSNQYILLKRLPWISNQMWDENLYYNTLWVEGHRWYNEAGYSLSGILIGGEIGVFAGFKANQFYGVGLKISYYLQ
jgi:hypothetical protein